MRLVYLALIGVVVNSANEALALQSCYQLSSIKANPQNWSQCFHLWGECGNEILAEDIRARRDPSRHLYAKAKSDFEACKAQALKAEESAKRTQPTTSPTPRPRNVSDCPSDPAAARGCVKLSEVSNRAGWKRYRAQNTCVFGVSAQIYSCDMFKCENEDVRLDPDERYSIQSYISKGGASVADERCMRRTR